MKQTNWQNNFVRILGYVEGVSLLLLLFIAVPLKRIYGIPEYVRVIGTIHGILFLMYAYTLFNYIFDKEHPKKWFFIGIVLGSIPFGSFWFDRKYLAQDQTA